MEEQIVVAGGFGNTCRAYVPKELFKFDSHFIHQNTVMIAVETPYCKEMFILDQLSACGGRDKETEEDLSWEFAMKKECVATILSRLFPMTEIVGY